MTKAIRERPRTLTFHAVGSRADEPWSREEVLGAALAEGMRFAPGNGWSYSNIGYMFVRELIEEIAANSLGQVISDMISEPLGLAGVEFWDTLEQSASLHWETAKGYDPGWVYHGCLIGTTSDAARLLHGLFQGELLQSETLRDMLDRHPVGGSISGRPWSECGYGCGLMSGSMGNVGRAIGHSGGGPFSVNAVYHFPDLAEPMTVACFTDGTDEGVAENAAVKIAQRE
ncbi:serine hydrolase domain-containing protein [Paracoccus marinaquae]|uniref:Beta-lactamase family protein n=1 Tax=Paracoccus marinaquae TaxID=2841926 RepID=A0ABS6APA2_9RHOB|nr:serine hydrolase domain-containing protein [Paracoccus marinaquae]MBU3032438.1 beta-lactamase family protein [Paracoccus marinaquae]